MTNGIRASDFSDMTSPVNGFTTTPYSSIPFQNPNFYHSYPYTPSPPPLLQYTPPPTPSHLFHFVEPPPHQFYTTSYTPYVPPAPILITDVTKDFLHHLDDKVIQLDVKMAQIRMLIEKKNTIADPPNTVQEDEFEISVDACQVPNPSTTQDILHKMEDKIAEILQTLAKMGKRCAHSPKLVDESVLGREVDVVQPELLSEDELGTVEGSDGSTLQLQSTETYSNGSKLLPVIPAYQVFDENSERVLVQKAPVLTAQGTNSIVFSSKLFWKAIKIDYDSVMLFKLHENEYGKIGSKFYKKFKNVMKATHVLTASSKIKSDKVLICKLHEDDHFKYLMKGRNKEKDTGRCYGNTRPGNVQLAEKELYQACEGIVRRVIEIDKLLVRGKAAWTMDLFVLVSTSGNVRGCKLFDNKLSRGLVVWNVKVYTPQQLARFNKIVVYKFHENEYGKVFGEFSLNFGNIVTATQLFHGLPVKDKVAWMIVFFVLINKSGHVRGCGLFDSMLDKNSVLWHIEHDFSISDEQIFKRWDDELPLDGYNHDLLLRGLYDHEKFDLARILVDVDGDGELMCCKLFEDERSKVLARSKESALDLKLLNTSVRLDVVMKCLCCNGHLWKMGLFLSSVSGTLGSPLMGKQIHCQCISSGFLFNTVVVDAVMILFCKWRKYIWERKRVILLRGAKFKNDNVVLRVGYNVMFKAYGKAQLYDGAFSFFKSRGCNETWTNNCSYNFIIQMLFGGDLVDWKEPNKTIHNWSKLKFNTFIFASGLVKDVTFGEIYVIKGIGKEKWNACDSSGNLVLQPLDKSPPRLRGKNTMLFTISKFEQGRENIALKQVGKGRVMENEKMLAWMVLEIQRLSLQQPWVIYYILSCRKMRMSRNMGAELATNAKVEYAKKSMTDDAIRIWYRSSSYMLELVETKCKVSLNLILEDKDVLKERNMSPFELGDNVGPNIIIGPR